MRALRLVLLGSLLAGPLSAQNPAPRLGILVGANFAKLTGDSTEFLDNRAGFLVGGFAELSLSKAFAIEPQVVYTQKGASASEPGVDVDLKLNYMQVPILLKYRFGSNGTVQPHVFAGPALAFKSSCTVAVSGDQLAAPAEFSCGEDSDLGAITGTDFSVIGGVGFFVHNLLVGARFDMGLTNIADVASQGNASVRTSTVSVYAGYAFRLP